MYANLSIAFPIFSSLLEPVSRARHSIAKRVQESLAAARQRRAVAGLSHHLSYDVGECEYRLPPSEPTRELNGQETLETMWLAYGCGKWMERR